MPTRIVNIHWTHLHRFDWPYVEFEMACGRGTYVRSLIRDLGHRLHTGGCLTALTRLAVGPFAVDGAWTFDRLEAMDHTTSCLIPLDEATRLVGERPVVIPERPRDRQ